jgi:hypothetical protein
VRASCEFQFKSRCLLCRDVYAKSEVYDRRYGAKSNARREVVEHTKVRHNFSILRLHNFRSTSVIRCSCVLIITSLFNVMLSSLHKVEVAGTRVKLENHCWRFDYSVPWERVHGWLNRV